MAGDGEWGADQVIDDPSSVVDRVAALLNLQLCLSDIPNGQWRLCRPMIGAGFMGRLLLLLVSFVAVGGGSQHSIFGNWRTADGKAIVSIERCGVEACGTITAVLDRAAPRNDTHNPNEALRRRDLVGLRILSGFVIDGGRWRGGRAYDPSSGRSYAARMSLADDGRLAVTGCLLFLCRTQYWTRAATASGNGQ